MSTRTVVLTLGRLPKGLDIARAFAAAGWRVVVAEPFRRHLCGASRSVARSWRVTAPNVDRERYLRDLLEIIARERAELVIPISEETVHVAFLRERLPASVRLYTMPPDFVLELHDKLRFIGRCNSYQLAVPETYNAADPRARGLAEHGDFIVKPTFSCSGIGVRFASRGESFVADDRFIVQRRVQGDVRSTFSIAHAGRRLATVIYRGVVMSGTVAVCFERVEGYPQLDRWVDDFIAKSNYTGFVSFDFLVDPAGAAYAVECNPRATSGLHFVEPADLVRAVLTPDDATPVRMRAERLMQQFYPCLTETQKSVGSGARFRSNLRYLRAARDVTWSLKDPWPFVSMPLTSFTIIALALRRGTTFGAVATLDVGWYANPSAGG
jgi:predicted ATP-grasp superfamily ATP-dependent carboligase